MNIYELTWTLNGMACRAAVIAATPGDATAMVSSPGATDIRCRYLGVATIDERRPRTIAVEEP